MSRASEREACATISERLVEGWTLLNRTCPNGSCNTPLVRNKAKEIYCARCRMWCVDENKLIAGNKVPSSAIPDGSRHPTEKDTEMDTNNDSPDPLPNTSVDDDEEDSWSPPSPEEQARIDARRRKADEVSAKLGQYMLRGWTMMDLHCANAECCSPLMRDPKTFDLHCVSCGRVIPKEGQDQEKKENDAVTQPGQSSSSARRGDTDVQKQPAGPEEKEARLHSLADVIQQQNPQHLFSDRRPQPQPSIDPVDEMQFGVQNSGVHLIGVKRATDRTSHEQCPKRQRQTFELTGVNLSTQMEGALNVDDLPRLEFRPENKQNLQDGADAQLAQLHHDEISRVEHTLTVKLREADVILKNNSRLDVTTRAAKAITSYAEALHALKKLR